MGFSPKTPNGHNMYDMSSMLQKAIRRADFNHAGYAVNELYYDYTKYTWKRLLVISAEDCFGIVTREIIGLKLADDEVNYGKKGKDRDPIFVAKAVTLLCQARKNRDACYFACNYMCVDRILNDDEIEHINLEDCDLGVEGIPDWVFDVHTLKGRRNGKTDLDMTISEQEALTPLQPCLFDEEGWENYYHNERKNGSFSDKEWTDIESFIENARRKKIEKVRKTYEDNDLTKALKLAYIYRLGRNDDENIKLKEAYEVFMSEEILYRQTDTVKTETEGIEVLQKI